LYTFGCGAGGRLGLGEGSAVKKLVAVPARVCSAVLAQRRAGRCWRLARDKELAWMMLTHARLAAQSPAEAVPVELLRRILELTGVAAEAAQGLAHLCHVLGGLMEE